MQALSNLIKQVINKFDFLKCRLSLYEVDEGLSTILDELNISYILFDTTSTMIWSDATGEYETKLGLVDMMYFENISNANIKFIMERLPTVIIWRTGDTSKVESYLKVIKNFCVLGTPNPEMKSGYKTSRHKIDNDHILISVKSIYLKKAR